MQKRKIPKQKEKVRERNKRNKSNYTFNTFNTFLLYTPEYEEARRKEVAKKRVRKFFRKFISVILGWLMKFTLI